jgi:pyruvate dehydrogenase E2 component (dihydrolipoamide acetyltransferase)
MSEVFTVVLPDIGEGVIEGEVVEWLKSVGDSLGKDEPVVIIMTDKATVELPAPYPGILAKQYYNAGEISIKDEPLYDIDLAQGVEVAKKSKKKKERTAEEPKAKLPAKGSKCPHSSNSNKDSSLAIPKVRHMAKQMGINLDDIVGTGPEGRILLEDLQGNSPVKKSTAKTALVSLEGEERQPLQGVRRLIALKMLEAKSRAAHCHFFDEIEVSPFMAHYKKCKSENSQLTLTAFFLKALSGALAEFPVFNASIDWDVQEVVYHKPHNIAVAVKTQQGVMAPVIANVQEKDVGEIAKDLQVLKQEAQSGGISPEKMRGATVTLSNFGTEGGVFATPILNTPQSLILGLARVQKKPVVQGDNIVIGNVLNLSWSFDHCLIDGDLIAAFSATFKKHLLP